MVRSLLGYCSPLWNPIKICEPLIAYIQKPESRRVLKGHLPPESIVYMICNTGIVSSGVHSCLFSRRERYIIQHMWKLLHGQTSNDLQIQFVHRPRFGNQAKIPTVNKESSLAHHTLYDCSFAVMGPKLWNSIPYPLNNMSDFTSFKNQLTRFMLSVPDKPPIRGYTSPNTNSVLAWKNDRHTTPLWGGQHI